MMAVLVLSVALAQSPADGLRDARVGQWVSFRVDGGGGRVGHLRVAVVGDDADARGRAAVWVEAELGLSPDAPLMRLRFLAARRAAWSDGRVSRLWMAVGDEPPREVPPDALARGLWPVHLSDAVSGANQTRVLATPAGPIPARCVRAAGGGEACFSRRIPVLPVARLSLPSAGQFLEVEGFGTAAKARMVPPGDHAPTIRFE
jgi:hypothetical protein